jgi:hypothetical protein
MWCDHNGIFGYGDILLLFVMFVMSVVFYCALVVFNRWITYISFVSGALDLPMTRAFAIANGCISRLYYTPDSLTMPTDSECDAWFDQATHLYANHICHINFKKSTLKNLAADLYESFCILSPLGLRLDGDMFTVNTINGRPYFAYYLTDDRVI